MSRHLQGFIHPRVHVGGAGFLPSTVTHAIYMYATMENALARYLYHWVKRVNQLSEVTTTGTKLGGGNSYIYFLCSPLPGEINNPMWRAYFSNWLAQSPASCTELSEVYCQLPTFANNNCSIQETQAWLYSVHGIYKKKESRYKVASQLCHLPKNGY